jgi:long-chain acyl-CoA synthetase
VPSPIADAFREVSTNHRHRTAVFGLSESVTRNFAEVWDDFQSMKRGLLELRLPPRPTIVSIVGNRTGFLPLFLASLDLEAGFLPLDADATEAELVAISERLRADAVIVPGADIHRLSDRHVPLPCGLMAALRRPPDGPSWRANHETGARVLKLTSGSTSQPKVVVASENNLLADGRHIIEAMGIQPTDVGLATVPMAHSYGMGNLLMPLLLRGSSIAMRDGFVPGQLADDLRSCGITMLPGVPFMFDYLRRLGADAAPLASLRLIVTAGAPIDLETLRFFKQTYGQKLHSLYGTSETGGITFDGSDEIIEPMTVGVPLPGTSVTLVDAPGAPPGEGRVTVQGASVATRYALSGPANVETSQLSPDGFLSGDLGKLDAAGRLILTGRISSFINIAGRKVHPLEVERVIDRLSGVAQTWVMGVPCRRRGQMLVACIRRRETNLTVSQVRAYCVAHMSPHKIPRRILFVDDVPVDGRGKTDRGLLEARVKEAVEEAEDL